MLLAFVSLIMEIKRQPDCSSKRVCDLLVNTSYRGPIGIVLSDLSHAVDLVCNRTSIPSSSSR
jgi:hypothetical protein